MICIPICKPGQVLQCGINLDKLTQLVSVQPGGIIFGEPFTVKEVVLVTTPNATVVNLNRGHQFKIGLGDQLYIG
jgi:hypothetical protein